MHLAIGNKVLIARHDFVIDELYWAPRSVPLAFPRCPITADYLERQIGCPLLELARPVHHQWLRADDQRATNQAALKQEPKSDDDLGRLAQPHFVGEERRVARHQESNSL